MIKKRRSRKRRQAQRRAAASQKRRSSAAVTPPRRPAKLRAKIRIRPVASSAHQQTIPPEPREELPEITPVNRLVSLDPISLVKSLDPALNLEPGKIDLFPAPTSPPRQIHLPSMRTDLGDRPPVFQPIIHRDEPPTWEDQPEAPIQVTHSRGHPWITGLTLALLTTLVAGVAIRPVVREPSLLDPPYRDIPQTAEAPDIPLEKLDQLLHAPSVDARRSLVASPETIGNSIEDSTPFP